MTNWLKAVQTVVNQRKVLTAPIKLDESGSQSKCSPTLVRYEGESWALRLGHEDCLPALAELPKERSVRRLPDYLVFSTPRTPAARPDAVTLQVLICELKSSATGASEALPQVQLGKHFADYLVRISAHAIGCAEGPKLWYCGLIASPELPPSLMAKGRTRPGKIEPPNFHDKLSNMRIYTVPGGGELRLESIY